LRGASSRALGAFLANFDSRLTTVGLPDLRGAFSLGFDEGAWLSTAGIGSQIFIAPSVAWLATAFGPRPPRPFTPEPFGVAKAVMRKCGLAVR